MCKGAWAALAIASVAAGTASASVTVSSVDGSAPFGVPATFQFDTPVQLGYSGTVYFDSNVNRARPAGSTGGYAAVGPGNAETSAFLDLSSFGDISSITFLWGSVDLYNTLVVNEIGGGSKLSFNGGSQGVKPADGNQGSSNSNRLVTLTFTGADRSNVSGLTFSSTGNAFEFDNVNVVTASVPEASTWAMMLGGFGLVGGALRRRQGTSIGFA